MSTESQDMRTPLNRVRGLGAGRTGTTHFWYQRVTSVAGVPLVIAFIVVVMTVMGRNHAAAVQILGSPVVTILMLLFVFNTVYHMWIGMQEIILDYVHHETGKLAALIANNCFCFVVGFACAYALLKLSFGV